MQKLRVAILGKNGRNLDDLKFMTGDVLLRGLIMIFIVIVFQNSAIPVI
jgi:hypothetical protein